MEQPDVIDGRKKAARKKHYMLLGLVTLGGESVIGLYYWRGFECCVGHCRRYRGPQVSLQVQVARLSL